jgi:ABC-type multidrug transport system fused ATPase/permease subunit
MSNFEYYKLYLKDFIQVSGKSFALACLLNTLTGLVSGIGLIMLIPLFYYTGWLPLSDQNNGINAMISYLPSLDGQLPLLLTLAIFVAIITLIAGLMYWTSQLNTILQNHYIFTLRNSLNHTVAHAHWSYLTTTKLKHVDHMITSGVGQITLMTHYSMVCVGQVIICGLYFVFSIIISAQLTLVVAILAIVLMGVLRKNKAILSGKNIFSLHRDSHEQLSQFLDGLKLAKSYNKVDAYITHYTQLNLDILQWQQVFAKSQRSKQFLMTVMSALIFAVLVGVAFYIFNTPVIHFVALLLIYSRLLPKLSTIQQSYIQILNLAPVFKEMQDMRQQFSTQQEITQTPQPISFTKAICLSQVSYSYPHLVAVKSVSHCFKANTTTAIVGHSGAGKSTIADLILGLLVPHTGHIIIDDIPLTSATISAWRDMISYVPQDPYLFNASLADNLKWAAPTATTDDMWNALKLAAADTFVAKLPNQLDTVLGDRGIHLSGGERQRIALARALLRQPKVVVLDEATSALDTQNESLIYNTLKSLQGKTTIIIIAHRLSTIKAADDILVLDNGQIIEKGTLTELSSKNSHFSKLFLE